MKPTVPEVLPLVREYYEDHPTGGALHIVLDDGNVSDSHVEFCRAEAARRNDLPGYKLALKLQAMSKTQRLKLSGRVYG